MSKVSEKIKEEFLALLPPTIFFFIALHIVALVRSLMERATGLSAFSSASIAVAALILGKAVLIADMLPIINRYPDKPLIYNVAWKTLIYLVVSAIIHYLERLYEFTRQAGGMVAANHEMAMQMIWPRFWAIQIVLFVMVLAYCTLAELARAIGGTRLLRVFFGPPPLPVLTRP
jgi:hypothetical protein